jgi:hypothetical protein
MQVCLVVINLDVDSTDRNEIQSMLSSAEKAALTFRHRSFTFNSNKSPT